MLGRSHACCIPFFSLFLCGAPRLRGPLRAGELPPAVPAAAGPIAWVRLSPTSKPWPLHACPSPILLQNSECGVHRRTAFRIFEFIEQWLPESLPCGCQVPAALLSAGACCGLDISRLRIGPRLACEHTGDQCGAPSAPRGTCQRRDRRRRRAGGNSLMGSLRDVRRRLARCCSWGPGDAAGASLGWVTLGNRHDRPASKHLNEHTWTAHCE